MGTEQQYKRTIAGSVGAGIGSIFNGSGRTYYILEHKTQTANHQIGESQKIIVDQIELGRDSSCQVRFDESCGTVSRKHAAIVREGDNWKIIPLSQTNATFVNGMPIQGERMLVSGDEIKLSSHGPVMGFIVPQGAQSLVKSIGMTERMNLFRQQALRPYRTALTILSIVLVVAIGGLVTYNIMANKEHQEQIAKAQEEIQINKDKADELSNQIARQKKEMEEQSRLAAINDSIAKAKQEELAKASEEKQAELKAELTKAQNTASAAYSKINAIKKEQEKNAAELAAAKEKIEIAQEAIATANEAAEVAEEPAPQEEESNEIADITGCYNAVFYIKMNDIVIYDCNNREIARFNTENKIGGTGFMLEDGRFVTARRVVEPWFYKEYADGTVGYDSKNYEWTYRKLQVLVNHSCKVVANCTAYSPSGVSFQFKNTDLTKYSFAHTATVASSSLVEVETYSPDRYLRTVIGKTTIKEVRWYSAVYQHDWATMAKTEILNNIKGIAYSNSVSIDPKAGVEVSILGYPSKIGFSDSQSISPVNYKNSVNVSGLNNVGIIEMSSRRYQEGNDGAPVIQEIDGEWVVIGILSHTDSADRDVVIPIYNTSK